MKDFFRFIHLIWILCWATLATLVVFVPCIVAAYLSSTGNLAFNLTKIWARIVLAASFVRIRIINRERIAKGVSYIIVANHTSFYDILAIVTTLGIQFRWVIKKGVLKVPLFGYALYAARNIFIDRSNPKEAMGSIHRGTERLPKGVSVMIFPEGGRSMDGAIKPFKKGGFVMAIDKKWPVLPITINGSRAIHAKTARGVSPGTIEVVVGEPIDSAPYGQETMGSLIERARSVVISNHKSDSPDKKDRVPAY
jgi:1-acyl-sn-glycerol-3-phosphate acyltransferase